MYYDNYIYVIMGNIITSRSSLKKMHQNLLAEVEEDEI